MLGQTISHYKILEKLGEGGMGVVYKAQDLKLDRLVALKFLPQNILSSEEEIQRFQQEAKSLSALNHPNIAIVYDLDEAEGQRFIVLEFLPGGTLKSRIKTLQASGKQLPIEEVVQYGIQIAEGLAHAHRHGIVHRDIKSDNVMLTEDGSVKITDFGLAKLRGGRQLTKTGSTVGTAAYMSPEQIRGGDLDNRSDLFSFGTVLYELTTTRLPFRGEHEAALIYSIVNENPAPLKAARPDVPDLLENVISRCLEKDRAKRFQAAEEILLELKKVRLQFPSFFPLPRQRAKLPWLTAAILAMILIAYAIFESKKAQPSGGPLNIVLTQVTFAEGIEEYPAWSPDGTMLAYCREANGYRKIFVKKMGTGEENQLTKGSTDDIQPAWSRDGKSVLFVRSNRRNGHLDQGDIFGQFDGGDIWMIDKDTGKEVQMIANGFNPSFSPDGQHLAFDASWAGPHRIWMTDNHGTNPRQVSSDTSEAVAHIIPRWSPDGSIIVFQNNERTVFDIKVVDIRSGKTEWVTHDLFLDLNPVWSPSGKEIYFSSYRSGGLNIWRISASSGGAAGGKPQQITTGAGQDVEIAISPDGRRLAFAILKQNADIWKLPVSDETGKATGQPEQVIATTREDSRGAWSPDGRMIAFNSDRGGDMNIWVNALNDGSTLQLTKGAGGDYQPNWSPDAKTIAFFSSRSGNADIWTVDVASGKMEQLTKVSSLEINPFFSPDGKYIAYQSDAGGRLEPWVMKNDGSEERKLADMQVSGHFMRWSKDGNALLFRSPNPFQPGDWSATLASGEPTFVLVPKGGGHMSYSPHYDLIMDLLDHKELWVTSLKKSGAWKVFEFIDPTVRIDYPVWSPDGKWVLFDRVKPQGGDIWMMEHFE